MAYTFLGRRMEATWETTECETNTLMVFKSTSGPVSYEGRWTCEPAENGTRFTYVLDTELGGFFGTLADPLVARLYQRQLETNLGTLTELLEARAEESA
jgi:hypothetical protein